MLQLEEKYHPASRFESKTSALKQWPCAIHHSPTKRITRFIDLLITPSRVIIHSLLNCCNPDAALRKLYTFNFLPTAHSLIIFMKTDESYKTLIYIRRKITINLFSLLFV